ncbi:6165_t:CDS:2 [Entrophospora sp. SA101]|nr:6165_t:CDS:2 [Entrophospora sp. SA101]
MASVFLQNIKTISPLLWQCEKLHTWQTSFNVIKYQNTWCPYYVRDKHKLTLEDAKQFAFNKRLSTFPIKAGNAKLSIDIMRKLAHKKPFLTQLVSSNIIIQEEPVESNDALIRNNYKRSHIIEAHFKTIIKLRDLLEIEPMLSVITNNNNSFNGNDKFKTVKSHFIAHLSVKMLNDVRY